MGPPRAKHPSAASRNAGRAATARSGGGSGLIATHPNVHMPKRLSQHDQEEILLRCANRVAPYSLSVDTLVRSLKTIQSNPGIRKYQSIDTTSAAFQRSLNAPGVLDFLRAVNFHSSPATNNRKTLTLSHFDPAAFYVGISALEQIQQTSPEYAKDKALRVFQKELDDILATKSVNEDETSARERYLSKLPSEPINGSSPIVVEFGLTTSNGISGGSTNANDINNKQQPLATKQHKISRGFDSDDTLGDVVNWLGGHASVIPTKLETGEWTIVDRNRNGSEEDYNYHRLDVSELSNKTLHYIGCWPSGRIAVVPRFTAVLAN